MGIDKDVAKFLLAARARAVDFTRSLTLGSQQFQVSKTDRRSLAAAFDLENLDVETTADFFALLGARELSAMDFSDYEGATLLHDLNQPVGAELKNKYTFVLDGGTLEHVFNFPTALANAMQMVAVNGHLMIVGGGNNFLGHGFYQFSPELFYRTLNHENGFAVKRLIAAEVGGRWFEVADPQTVKSRVELINGAPVYLMVLAQKIAEKPLFERAPQQSDYVELWENEAAKTANDARRGLKNILKKNEFVRAALLGVKQKQFESSVRRTRSFANGKIFKLVDK